MAEEIDGLIVRISGDASDLERTISQVGRNLDSLNSTTRRNTSDTNNNTSSHRDNAKALQDTGKKWKEVGEGIDSVTKPVQVASVALATGGVAAAKFAIDFEDSFASVKKTVDGTPQQLEAIKKGIIDLSTTGINGRNAIPLTTAELNALAAAGGQLGIQTENIVEFTETMAQLQSATNLVGEEGASTMARYANVMKIPQNEIKNVGSAIVDLGNNSATTEAEIAAMALRMGKYGQTVGMGAADVLGYSAALSSLGIEAQLGGSAIGRTWLAIETAVASGGDELEAFAKYSGKSAKDFKEQWNTDSKGAFNGLLKGLQSAENLTLALDELGINNTQDIQTMMALVNGFDLVTESVERANTAYVENTALQAEFDAKAETTASKLQVTKNNLVEAARSIGETLLPSIADASEGVAGFTQKLASLDDEQKKTLVNTAGGIIALGAAAKGVSVGAKTIGDFMEGLGKIGEKAPVILKAISAIKTSTAGLGSTSMAMTPVAGVVLAPAAVVAGYKIIADHVTEAIENNAKLGQSYKELYDTWSEAKGKADNVSALRDEYDRLNKSINSGDLTPEELEKANSRIKAIMEEIKSITNDETIKLMIDTGDFEAALDIAVEEAEASAEKIRNALNGDGKQAQKAVSEGYDAVTKGSMYGADYRNQRKEMAEWLQYAESAKNDYVKITNEMNEAYAKGDGARVKELAEIRQGLIEATQKDLGDVYTKLTGSDFHFGDEEELIAQIENVKNAYVSLDETIGSMDARAANGRKSLEDMTQAAQQGAMQFYGFRNIPEVFAAGDEAVNNIAEKLNTTMSEWGFKNQDIAQQIALFRNGFMELQGAINSNAIDSVIADFVQESQRLNMASTDIVQKAALMKNGFSDIQQALASGDTGGLINDLGNIGNDLGMSIQQIDALARSLGLLPENKHVEFTANGFEVVEGAIEKLKEIDTEDIHVSIGADGDISVLNQATGATQILTEIGAVSLQVNADGNIDVLNEAGEKVAEVQNNPSATITVTAQSDTEPAQEGVDSLDDQDVTVDVDANVSAADAKIKGLEQTITITANYVATGDVPKSNAKGTQNFPGGLAMVNDQKGIADNRELIIDRGRAFIPEGRNVILPLSKGAKVYTASQTQAIMRGLGIPHYASGKNNSDAFTLARDNWNHYTKTNAVTTTQELEKWVEFSEQFKSNEKDIADIQEQIYSLMRKQNDELNKQSDAYIKERSALNDWEAYGDSPVDAFNRVRERNLAEVEAGRQTWKEYTETMSDIGSDMYNDRIKQSENWLAHEEKYNGMSTADYLAGIDRMKEYTAEYYAQGIIGHQEYIESMTELDEEYLDKRKEQLEEMYEASKAYISEHTYFNDWSDDDPLSAYNRVKDRQLEALKNEELTQEEYDKYMSELGSAMLSERTEQSMNWLDEQRKYFGMSDEEYVAGLERIKAYTQQYYDEGLIGRREYNEAITELNHSMWDEAASAYDEMLSNQQKYISDLRQQFSDEEQALRDSWTVEDRATDIADVKSQLGVYRNAVTDRGQQKYKELEEQMKQLQREEELYQLEVANNAVIEKLEAEYEQLEADKAEYLKGIAQNTDIDVSGIVGELTEGIENSSDGITDLLSQILGAFSNFKIEAPTYSDNRQITQTFNQVPADGAEIALPYLTGG